MDRCAHVGLVLLTSHLTSQERGSDVIMTYKKRSLVLALACALALCVSFWVRQPISVRHMEVRGQVAESRHVPARIPWDDVTTWNYNQISYDTYRESESVEDQVYYNLEDYLPQVHTLEDPVTHRSSQIDFDAIHKGTHPDVYIRLFGAIFNNASHNQPQTDHSDERKTYSVPQIATTKLVNCSALFSGDDKELAKAKSVMERHPKVPILEETYQEWCKDCDRFKTERGYVLVPLTEEEENYPLAFSIAVYTDIEAVERLLRAIYQPQNLYCIHVDVRSPLLFHQTVYALTSCFPNVFVASHLDRVVWGDVTVLLPAMNCMRDLINYHRGKWKYYINLTGQEFPLRTNWELVQFAKILNGSNDIGGSKSRMEMDRVKYRWRHKYSAVHFHSTLYNTMEEKEPDVYNLTFYKGELHGVFAHKMVEFLMESEVGQGYFRWVSDTGHPTEHYWNTLNYNMHVAAPGGYEGPEEVAHNYSTNQIARAKHWVNYNYGSRRCAGKVARGICVYGVGDLAWLSTRKELVANKFYMTFEYLAYDCLEERHRTRTSMRERVPFDADFYKSLPTVKYGRKDGL